MATPKVSEVNVMAELQRTAVTSDLAPQPLGAYSVGMTVTAQKLIFVAGQVGVDLAGALVGPGDAAAQTRQVFQNIGGVLESAGAGFNNVVEFTTYVVGREAVQGFIDGRSQVFPEIFPDGDYPPNTLLVVDGLVREEFLVEIKAVAALA
jgi:enamine deaminase RidA (YjgF/YER057c/UK114 family)